MKDRQKSMEQNMKSVNNKEVSTKSSNFHQHSFVCTLHYCIKIPS